MYKNIVPLPEVSEDPPVGPQINTGSEIGVREGVYVCVCVRCCLEESQGAWSAGFITLPMNKMDPEMEITTKVRYKVIITLY